MLGTIETHPVAKEAWHKSVPRGILRIPDQQVARQAWQKSGPGGILKIAKQPVGQKSFFVFFVSWAKKLTARAA